MYAIKEISTGKWLLIDGVTFVDWNEETDPQILEEDTEAELGAIRDEFNSKEAGRTGIFSSPRPH